MSSLRITSQLLEYEVFKQETDYTCGGAVVRAMLNYYGILKNRSENEINVKLKTRFKSPNLGTHPDNMISFLKREGLYVLFSENGSIELLCHYINQQIPIIVLDSKWGGHWSAVVGYDCRGSLDNIMDIDLFLADPSHEHIEMHRHHTGGITKEKASNFYNHWYESELFEKYRERFYIAAYFPTLKVITYKQ